MYFHCLWGVLCWSLVWYALLYVLSSFEVILTRRRESWLLYFYFRCLVTVNVLLLFLTVPWVGLQFVIVVFPDHSHLRFDTVIYTVLLLSFFNYYSYQIVFSIWGD